jgi:hypothetical protein
MIDTEYLRRKYAPRPCVMSPKAHTPAGRRDIEYLCDELDRVYAMNAQLRARIGELEEEVRRGTVLPE